MITDAFQPPHLEQSPRLWGLALNVSVAPCVGEQEEEARDSVALVMMSANRLDPAYVKDLLTQALADYRGERLPVHPNAPVLDEFMQRSSWRLAIHGAQTASQRSLHTSQTEIWLRDEAGDAYPVLCQAFSPDSARIDEVLNAASAFRWVPSAQALREAE